MKTNKNHLNIYFTSKRYCYLKETNCILYRIQKKQNDDFDGTSYTKTMLKLFDKCYSLPDLETRLDSKERPLTKSSEPYDELFIWSLLLINSNETKALDLIRFFWSKTKHPIACSLAGIVLLKEILNQNFIPEDVKDTIHLLIK
jgi:hypothetical protein